MEAQRANGEAAAARILVTARQPGNPPVINDVEPWRVALQRGRRGSPLAVRTNRNAGIRIAPKPCSRPLSDNRHARAAALDGKRKGVKGTLAAPAAAPPVSRKRGDGSPITTQLPHARPGAALRPRGAVDHASPRLARALGLRPPRTLRCSLSIRARRRRRGSRDELRDRRAEVAPAQRAQVLVG